VGIAGAINWDAEKAFKDLLFLDILRGKHSTGVAQMYGAKDRRTFRIFKEVGNAVDVMAMPGFVEVMKPKSRIFLGHNRFATKGAINVENAHPFEFENVIGAHNGTLYSYYNMHNAKDYSVDSQALYSELNENGVESMWGKVNGAAALTWIDKKTNTINLLRNKERPLYYVYANKGKTLLWASEDWMLYVAAGRNGIELDGKPYLLPVNELHTFNVGEFDADGVTLERKAVAPYVAPKYTYSYKPAGTSSDSWEKAGEEYLTKEGVRVGGEIEFEVELIKDSKVNGLNKVTVIGQTLKGTPIRIWNLDEGSNEDVVDKMTLLEGAVFSGNVLMSSSSGLVVAHKDIKFTGYTVDDILEAEEELKAKGGKVFWLNGRNLRKGVSGG
jgi:hypothetical protein